MAFVAGVGMALGVGLGSFIEKHGVEELRNPSSDFDRNRVENNFLAGRALTLCSFAALLSWPMALTHMVGLGVLAAANLALSVKFKVWDQDGDKALATEQFGIVASMITKVIVIAQSALLIVAGAATMGTVPLVLSAIPIVLSVAITVKSLYDQFRYISDPDRLENGKLYSA